MRLNKTKCVEHLTQPRETFIKDGFHCHRESYCP